MNRQSNKGVIVIAGDSWACGEWAHDNDGHYKISHKGLTQYFIDDGFTVINLGKPGGANIISADRVDNFLNVSGHLDIRSVLVFQTEWSRDIFQVETNTLKEDIRQDYDTLKNRFISRFYCNLSRACANKSIPVYLIGGASDTIWLDKFDQEYPGVKVVCQSLTNLVTENCHRISMPTYSMWTSLNEQQLKYLKKQLISTDLELLLHDIDLGHQRIDFMNRNKTFFYPDGSHANQKAHFILFEFLKQTIPELL